MQCQRCQGEQFIKAGFDRVTAYLYHSWDVIEHLQVTGGLAYDHLTMPVNLRSAPFSAETRELDQWSPKAGVIWTPAL